MMNVTLLGSEQHDESSLLGSEQQSWVVMAHFQRDIKTNNGSWIYASELDRTVVLYICDWILLA